jgi:hypothetical protein
VAAVPLARIVPDPVIAVFAHSIDPGLQRHPGLLIVSVSRLTDWLRV